MSHAALSAFERTFYKLVLEGLYLFTQPASGNEFPSFGYSQVLSHLLKRRERGVRSSIKTAAVFSQRNRASKSGERCASITEARQSPAVRDQRFS